MISEKHIYFYECDRCKRIDTFSYKGEGFDNFWEEVELKSEDFILCPNCANEYERFVRRWIERKIEVDK